MGVLRGLHFQHPASQGKLVSVLQGKILDVALDVRLGSPTFGQHVAVTLDADSGRQFWIPRGFAHGFLVLSEAADVLYKCDEIYRAEQELVIKWDDPALGIAWGISTPLVSDRDRAGRILADLTPRLPKFG